MNKIRVIDNKISNEVEDINVAIEDNTLIIEPKVDTSLELNFENIKKILINVKENINFELFELSTENNNIEYEYNVDKNSNLKIVKFYDAKEVNEKDTINLNGEYATVYYNLKTISNGLQNYNLKINHLYPNTISNIKNSGVNISGAINFTVEGIIPKGSFNSETNQNNRIITFNDNVCKIDPILLIDENDVNANHSALIGKFNEDELFYLESRGIDYDSAVKLLVKGFLLDGIDDERVIKQIDKYWR